MSPRPIDRITPDRRRTTRRRLVVLTTLAVIVGAMAVAAPRPAPEPASAAMTTTTFVPYGSTGWRVSDDGSDPGPGWRMTSFDPSPWRTATMPVGSAVAGAGNLATGATSQYLIRSFDAPLAGVRLLHLRLRRDDGVVVYLNGRPVARTAMPFGEPTHTTPAWSATTGVTYQTDDLWLPREYLRDGRNVIALELHQVGPGDDAYLDVELSGVGGSDDVTAPAAPSGSVAEVTDSAIRLRWTAPADPSGIAAYRIRRGTNTIVVAQTSWGTQYLDQQLAPGAISSYSITAIDRAGNESPPTVLSARTLLPANTPVVRLQAAGDIGSLPSSRAMFDAAGAESADAFVALGDLAYQAGGEAAWCRMVRNRLGTRPVELVTGNHEDDHGDGGSITNFAACLPDRIVSSGTYPTNYTADLGSLVRLVVISPNVWAGGRYYDYFPGNQERRWLVDAIAAGRAANRWVVVAMHHPCITVGEKSCEIRPDLMDVVTGADLLLTGHDHTYQRTQQFGLQSGCTTFTASWANPRCVTGDGYGGSYRAGRGVVQVVAGVGGQNVNPLDLADPVWPYVVLANGSNSWSPATGYLRVTATPAALAVEFRATEGRFGDSFTIRR